MQACIYRGGHPTGAQLTTVGCRGWEKDYGKEDNFSAFKAMLEGGIDFLDTGGELGEP